VIRDKDEVPLGAEILITKGKPKTKKAKPSKGGSKKASNNKTKKLY